MMGMMGRGVEDRGWGGRYDLGCDLWGDMIYWYESLNSEIYDLKLFNENKLGEKGAHLGNVETRPSKIKGVYI